METTPTLFQMDKSPAERTEELATIPQSTAIPVAAMLQAMVDKGVTQENMGALEKMVDLYERMQNREAERDYARAFAALQAEIPRIKATKVVPDKFGNKKFKFAPYEEIMDEVAPLLLKHGFTITFSMDFREGRIIQTCTLQHVTGHKHSNQFAVRIGNGPPGASESQADGAASTYAKRFALCSALNITIDVDSDAKNEGAPITADQALHLRELVKETKSDENKFLRFAGAATYEEIGSTRYDALAAELHKRQRG